MEVRDDEERVVHLQVERNRRDHYTGESADDEQEKETDDELERRREARAPTPDGGDPAEDLDSRWYRYRRARRCEEALAKLRQRRREHVVDPKPEAEERRAHQRQDHRRIAEDPSLGERFHHRRHHPQGRYENDVDLGMPEEPEQVLPQDRVATLRRIEEMRVDE